MSDHCHPFFDENKSVFLRKFLFILILKQIFLKNKNDFVTNYDFVLVNKHFGKKKKKQSLFDDFT